MVTTRTYPSILQAVLLLLAFVALQIVFGIVATVFGLGVVPTTALSNVFAALFVLLWGAYRSNRPLEQVLPFTSFRAVVLLPLVLVIAGLNILLSDVDNVTRWLLPVPDIIGDVYNEFREEGVAAWVLIVMVAPLTEEPLFRGLILGGFAQRYSVRAAVLWSALLFAMVHLNPYQLAGAFVLGLLFGWLFLKTGSLWPCIFAHALNNAAGWIASILGVDVVGYTSELDAPVQFQPLWFDGLGLLLFLFGLVPLTVLLRDRKTEALDADENDRE